MTPDVPALRARLRALPVFPETVPAFDVDAAPAEPVALFVDWLDHAVDAGQPAPHAPVLSTSGATGEVAARTLALKDVDSRGWWFATHATSPKGRDLAANPSAAMTFFWPVVGRQVRVAGRVVQLGPEEVARDFLARRPAARAATLVGHQSQPLASADDHARALDAARARLDANPQLVDPEWAVYVLVAHRVEFWSASHDRAHTRLLYTRSPDAQNDDSWTQETLWP